MHVGPLGRECHILRPQSGPIGALAIDKRVLGPYGPPPLSKECARERTMKVVNSLKTMKTRHKECRVVRRKGRVYVINKRNPRFKARQG